MPALDETDEKPLRLSIDSFSFSMNTNVNGALMERQEPRQSRHISTNSNKSIAHIEEQSQLRDNERNERYIHALAGIKTPDSPIQTFHSKSTAVVKLPNIDLSQTLNISRVASRVSNTRKLPYTSRSIEYLPKLVRAPSYISNFDTAKSRQDKNGAVTTHAEIYSLAIARNTDTVTPIARNADSVTPLFTRKSESKTVKLPSIFQHNNVQNPVTMNSPSTRYLASPSRDASPYFFKRDQSFLSSSRMDLSLVGRQSKINHRNEPNLLQRSGTHMSPLLLPICVNVHKRAPAIKAATRKDYRTHIGGENSITENSKENLVKEGNGDAENSESDRLEGK